jgi:hypothetical protein
MWFLFAFALSVETAFGNLGQNTTAHDLALGCLLAWFPILIMGSIVDRNPIAAEAIRKKLNTLIDHVRNSLRNEHHRNHFIHSFRDHPDFEKLKSRVEHIAAAKEFEYEFFEEFAGQGRIRWHYGAAHPILSDIEDCYIAGKGRNWLADEHDARMNLVLGTVNDEGLMWFDIREFWQVMSAIVIVASSCGGAFILSFFTPTVGLGCRSGGYTVFFTISLGLMMVEMTVWLRTSPYQMKIRWLAWVMRRLRKNTVFAHWEDRIHVGMHKLGAKMLAWSVKTENEFIEIIVWLALLIPKKNQRSREERITKRTKKWFREFRRKSTQEKWETFFFRPVEVFNMMWLVSVTPKSLLDRKGFAKNIHSLTEIEQIYIVIAQTFGWYKTCDCMTSNWGGGGGYLDFAVQDISNSKWVAYYWVAGTCLSGAVLLLSIFYITVEVCYSSLGWLHPFDD